MTPKIDLVFLWHMHQPDYRDHATGEFILPWVYLHAIKDYTDMAAHLERHPQIRAVVNFVPVLLDQIDDYVDQFTRGEFRDPLLRLLARPSYEDLSKAEQEFIRHSCFRCNIPTMVSPFAAYQRLHAVHMALGESGNAAYLSSSYYADLITWYHLAWSGETERRAHPLLRELLEKGGGFTYADRLQLLEWIGATLRHLLPRYRALQLRGQIELSCTPQTHPLAPLLLDFSCARDTQPQAPLPQAAAYPGGVARVNVHIHGAQASHAQRFGNKPCGMWPAEGALSSALVRQMSEHGVNWLASGEGVLNNSLRASGLVCQQAASRPWRLSDAPRTTLFFRNERLSDLIGFEYSRWHSGEAAKHFVAELDAIAAAVDTGERPVVSVILDGENAWEYYPFNGFYFFDEMYALLGQHAEIRTTSFESILSDADRARAQVLPRLMAGSWVYGSLSTWIGDVEKNRAWDLLCAVKEAYDNNIGNLDATRAAAAEQQLAVCESSDWFWWFGGYNPAASVESFDRLYRHNLAGLYELLGQTVPEALQLPIASGKQAAVGELSGSMRRAQQ